MLYVVYLDEFGHVGPYISADHEKYKTHPVFGFGGVIIPYHRVREFNTRFFKLKNQILKTELENSKMHPAKWEKKGASLYTTKNINKYKRPILRLTKLYLKLISEVGGNIIYVGTEKRRGPNLDSKNLIVTTLSEITKRINKECSNRNAQFLVILDQQEKSVQRAEIVERISRDMFGNGRHQLIEPPIEAESHLYQGLQCADWLCGLFGRKSFFEYDTEHGQQFSWYETYFKPLLEDVAIRSSIRAR